MSNFLHVGIAWKSGKDLTPKVQEKLGKAIDWVRYAPNCWLVYTNLTSTRWFERLSKVVSDEDYVFVCQIYPDKKAGRMPKWVWEWFRKHMPPVSAAVASKEAGAQIKALLANQEDVLARKIRGT